MANFVPELDAIYSDRKHVEITDREEIAVQKNSKASACWGAGAQLDLGYTKLCVCSPRFGELLTVFVCRTDAYNESN